MAAKKKVHIGRQIEKRFNEMGMSVAEFARRLNKANPSVYHMFKNPGINTETLVEVSEILEHNFFQYFTDGKNVPGKNEPAPRLMVTVEVDPEQHEKVLKALGLPTK